MNTFKNFKKTCAAVFAFLISVSATACEIPLPLPFFSDSDSSEQSTTLDSSSDSKENSVDSQLPTTSSDPESDSDSMDGDSTSSDSDSDSDSTEEEDDEDLEEATRIMDLAYALAYGESLSGTYTLTGVITSIDSAYSSSKGVSLTMTVKEKQSRSMYCYQLKGVGADLIGVGDTITVSGTIKNYKGTVEFDKDCALVAYVVPDRPTDENDPYKNVSKTEFYANYTVATSNEDAYYRSLHGFMSGELTVPDQAPTISPYRPKVGDAYVRNNEMRYEEDGKAYVVTDAYGNEAFTVYKDGGYITLEEVAAYVYAFGTYPKNHSASKDTSPSNSIWAEYLRLNHTSFSGSTSKYPYEPKLPNITGCGGTLAYYEMDIGTLGTDCDPSYVADIYNDGNSITRGAARIVYGKRDIDGDGVWEEGEFHLFYTYNHYNDFQEYLNYAGGWGEMFGNITGGGTISSKTDYNPTKYVSVAFGELLEYPATFNSKALQSRYFGL